MDDSKVLDSVKEYYGKILENTSSLKTSACTSSSKPHALILEALKLVPKSVSEKYYGCGCCVPLGIEGLNLLDLGSGSGQDCYIASWLVGQNGSVTGVDMTESQIKVANEGIESFSQACGFKPKLCFKQGVIENMKDIVENESMDIVISNCVVNLSPRKDLVLQEAYRVLKNGGEFYFSDVYCDRRVPESVQKDKILWGECISGAMYTNDFVRLCHKVGFTDPRQLESNDIEITDPSLKDIVGNAKFFSVTFRLFKLPDLETKCEDYGQFAIYKGTIRGHKHAYALDDHHVFVTNKPHLVCGNTASMLGESWLGDHFQVVGDRSTHFGEFPCGEPEYISQTTSSSNENSACCSKPSTKKSCC